MRFQSRSSTFVSSLFKIWVYVIPDKNPIKFVRGLWCEPLHSSVVWQITRAETDGPKTPPRVSLPVQFVKKRLSPIAFVRHVCSARWIERLHFCIHSGGDRFRSWRATTYPRVFLIFLSLPRGVTGCYLQLSHNRFLPDPLQFIIEKSPYHSSCWQCR
jgi:hypothetical protein